MKKTYFAPVASVVDLQAEQMIAASGVSVGVSETEVDANQALSNKQDMWGNSDIWN